MAVELDTLVAARVASAQFDATTNTTLADIAGLSVDLEAGEWYLIDADVPATGNVTGGVKFALGGTATLTTVDVMSELWDVTTPGVTAYARRTGTGAGHATASAAGPSFRFRARGAVLVDAAGTLTVTFAQSASNGTSSVLVGASLLAYKV
jgi:hypothetical protein